MDSMAIYGTKHKSISNKKKKKEQKRNRIALKLSIN